MAQPAQIAFYDFDGTLVSSNIVTRYAFFIRRLPSRARAIRKLARLIGSVPAYIVLEHYSRRLFNRIFFHEYRGMKREWLEEQAEALFSEVIRPSIYNGAKALVDRDREQGFRIILVTGELDFVLVPVMRYFGFDGLICNSLSFDNGIATGDVLRPLIAEEYKVKAMARMCEECGADIRQAKAYSDSFSDLPMLEAVRSPAAVNPDRRLSKVALNRGWPMVDLKGRDGRKIGAERGNHVHIS